MEAIFFVYPTFTTPEVTYHRRYWLLCGLVLLLSAPARLADIGRSLWLDEAWVANSLLSPTLHEVLYFDRWAQSTPPLFLVIARATTRFSGDSEPALRIVPLVSTLLGLLILAVILRRLFSWHVALLGFAFIVSNYWVIKYGQEVKQYGTDFLTSCVLLLVLERIVRAGCRAKGYLTLAMLGCAAPFLSFTSVFWFPSCVIAVALPDAVKPRKFRWARAVPLAVLLAASTGANYLAFIRPNLSHAQVQFFTHDFIDATRLGPSLLGLQSAFGALLIPLDTSLAKGAAWLTDLVLVLVAFRAMRLSLRGDRTATAILLGGPLPVAAAIVVSAARLYPILSYARLLVWALPCCVLLLGYALASARGAVDAQFPESYDYLLRRFAPAVCVALVVLSQAAFFRMRKGFEQNRAAAEFIRSHQRAPDVLFVHGGMNEQFLYYRRELSWHPERVYFGNTDWPCCPQNIGRRTSSPAVRDFFADLRSAAARAGTGMLWLLLPAGAPGHWSAQLGSKIGAIPAVLGRQGCSQKLSRAFGQTLVLAFSCVQAMPANELTMESAVHASHSGVGNEVDNRSARTASGLPSAGSVRPQDPRGNGAGKTARSGRNP